MNYLFLLLQANEELTKTQASLQKDRDEERHFVEVEREKLETLKAKHELAHKLSSEMEESVRKQLARESHEVVKAREDFEKLKKRQMEAIQEAEKTIQAKADSMVAEIWESRTELENKKAAAHDKESRIQRALSVTQSDEAKAALLQEADEIKLEIQGIEEETEDLDKKEQQVEKVIESEFVALEQRKKDDEQHLEEKWSELMQMEAANLQFIEQEMAERTSAFEQQREKLMATEAKLKDFQNRQKDVLNQANDERVQIRQEKSELKEKITAEEGKIQKVLKTVREQQKQLEQGVVPGGQAVEKQRSKVKALEEKRESLIEKVQQELNLDSLQLEKLVAAIEGQKLELEELLQTESFVEGKFKDEQRQLNEKIQVR